MRKSLGRTLTVPALVGAVIAVVAFSPRTQTVSAASVSDAPGNHHQIDLAHLPDPFATDSANNGPDVIAQPSNAALHVPAGFTIQEWASGLHNPRAMAVAPNGDVFLAESAKNQVIVLRDASGVGKATVRSVFTSDLRQPFGIAFYPPGPNPTSVTIANTGSVVRFPYHNGDLQASGPAATIVPDLPGGGYHQHWTRRIVFSPDGKKMYVSVGSKSNVGIEEERRAAILQFNPDGSGYRVYASGIRNAVGLAFNPVTHDLWTAVNERDGLGDDLVPDYVTSVKPGGFYGWPYYYLGAHHDPRMPERSDLRDRTIVPDVPLEAHSAALSVAFYTGRQFPKEYWKDAFVGMHGSWNRAARTGYKVVHVSLDAQGHAQGGYEDFVTGWVTPDGQVWGRPVDVVVAHDGSLLISDDGSGRIWRVSAQKLAR